MKFCSKCGKEIMEAAVVCPGCGCPVTGEATKKEASYDDCVKAAATTNIISAVVLAIGVLCALFVNVWLGVVLCLASELVAVTPNTKLQKAFKSNNKAADQKTYKEMLKQCKRDMKSQHAAFKYSFILAYAALACLIVFVLLA